MKKDDSFYPTPENTMFHGINVRDYIAIKAMQSFISMNPIINGTVFDTKKEGHIETIARQSYRVADKMIEESEKTE